VAFINFDFVRPARAIHGWFAARFKLKANVVRAQLIGYWLLCRHCPTTARFALSMRKLLAK
jgi:hypothetical protein